MTVITHMENYTETGWLVNIVSCLGHFKEKRQVMYSISCLIHYEETGWDVNDISSSEHFFLYWSSTTACIFLAYWVFQENPITDMTANNL